MLGSDFYQAIGGTRTCRKLSKAFYARVEQDPLLRPLFPGRSFTCAIEEFTAFLVQFLGGPSESSQRRWWLSLHESHRRFKMGHEHRDAWMQHMAQALNDAGIDEPARTALRVFFEHASAYVVDLETAGDSMHPELAHRWEAQRVLDEAVAAVRSGESGRAIALAQTCDRAVLVGLLALMIANGQSALLDYVHERLARDPGLKDRRYAGRTLLHTAAAAGRLATVELLLRLGADPNALDGGNHTPLYCLGNQCLGAECADVVRALVHGGAELDANDGVSRCTALHMAARRGNAVTAAALLDCGANIDARDNRGNTPLRRAINCKKTEVADLLRSYFCR